MNEKLHQLLQEARRWIDQERVWDDALYATQASWRGGVSSTSTGEPRRDIPTPFQKKAKMAPPPRPTAGGSARHDIPKTRSLHSSPAEAAKKATALQELYEKYKTCTRCPLGNSRLKFVFGVGNPDAEVLFIGEGPGYEEDHRGEPFIGRAGQLLDKMLEAIGFARKSVYIANIVKCHAMINPQTPHERGNDRAPTTLEAETCSPILQQQIAVIQPKIIVTLGSPSTRAILGTMEGISKIRGRFFPMPMSFFRTRVSEADLFETQNEDDFMGFTPEQLEPLHRMQVLPTYHPAALLRNPNLKKDSWEDMKLLRDTLRLPA